MKRHFILLFALLLSFYYGSFANQEADSLRALIENEKDNCKLSILHIELGNAIEKINLAESYQTTKKAIDYAKICNDSSLLANAYLNTGSRLVELGNKEDALANIFNAKQIFESIGDTRTLAKLYNNLAIIYIQAEDYNSALNFMLQGYEIAIKTNNYDLILFLNNNIGLCYQTIGMNDSALMYYNKSIEIIRFQKKDQYLGTVYLNIGECYSNLNYLDSSLYYYYKAMNYIGGLPDYGIGELYRLTSVSYLRKNQILLSKNFLDSTRYYAKRSGSFGILKTYYETQYKFDSTIRNYESAMKNLLALDHINDSVKAADYSQKMTKFKAIYDLEKQQNEIEVLKKQNEITTIKSKQKGNIILIALILIISLSTIVFLIYLSNKNKHRSIEKLNTKNNELNITLATLKKTQTQLIHSEKLASVGMLAKGAAHEINNPLNYINGGIFFIDELLTKPETVIDPSYKKFIKMIQEGISRIKAIVDGLDTFTETKNETLTASNINDLIDKTLNTLEITKHHDIKLSKEYQNIPSIEFYRSKIAVAIFNILNNAIDATACSTKKLITIKTKKTNSNAIEIHIYNSGNPIELNIQNKIYDPFFTTKAPSKGTGLGLTIANNIVKEHNGSISFLNKKGGVVFIISLPV